jgi:hypothetical protein
MPGTARSSLMLTLLGLMMALGLAAQGARTSLVVVKPGSDDAEAILQAQIVWMKTGSKTPVELSPILIKRNDKYAYLVARMSVPGSQPGSLDAVLEWKNGHWTSLGYMAGSPKHGGSISDMCGYGDGVGVEVFKECGTKRQRP